MSWFRPRRYGSRSVISDKNGTKGAAQDPNGNTVTKAYWDASRDGRLKSVTTPRITNNGSGAALSSSPPNSRRR